MIYKHDANILVSVVIPGYNYTLKLKILTENEVIVPTEGLITEGDRLLLAPGSYSDQLSIELTGLFHNSRIIKSGNATFP